MLEEHAPESLGSRRGARAQARGGREIGELFGVLRRLGRIGGAQPGG